MTRHPFLAVLLLVGLGALPARAEPELLCRRPEVIQILARQLRSRDIYMRADERTVRETPTGVVNAVRCTVYITTLDPVASADEATPRVISLVSLYTVQVVARRVMVHVVSP